MVALDVEEESSFGIVREVPHIVLTIEEEGIAMVTFPVIILGCIESHGLIFYSNTLYRNIVVPTIFESCV